MVLDRHPGLNVTFAHFFFLSDHLDRLEEIFRTYKNVGIDITPGCEMYESFDRNPQQCRDFFIRHADRIMYGTDCAFPDSFTRGQQVYDALTTDRRVTVGVQDMNGLYLPEETLKHILSENFRRQCHETPALVNLEALKRYVNKYQHMIQPGETKDALLQHMKTI